MAYDQALAARIRSHLAHRRGVTEKQMFGGTGFMLQGNMAVGVHKDALLVRLDPAQQQSALGEPHTRPFVMGSRAAKGFLLVDPPGTSTDAALGTWIDRAVAYAGVLPAKKKAAARATTRKAKPTRKAAARTARKR